MHTSVIIVGQGLCGTWLSYWLQQAAIPFVVIDEQRPYSSTRVASGIINPVTGRRMVRTWLSDEVIPFAEASYQDIQVFLSSVNCAQSASLISRCDVIDFFSSPDRRVEFEKRATQFAEHLVWPENEHQFRPHFNYELGFGIVAPAYQVDLQNMLDGWRAFLHRQSVLIPENFNHAKLKLTQTGSVQYEDITASHIIFADGIDAATHGYFQLLPFAANKGEALIVKIDGLPNNHIYKKGSTITPWRGGLFWVGSTYQHSFAHAHPTPEFRQQTEAWLRSFVKHDITVLDHMASVRPAVLERRPFVGWHPQHRQVGIFNGTGTKGVTLAPFFAKQLAENILHQTPLMPEVDVARFARVLSRM